MTTIIDSFNGRYRWLSNFWLSDITVDGITFPSVEHAYAFNKTEIFEERELFKSDCMKFTPSGAKEVGRLLTLRSDWDNIKYDVMKRLVRAKFEQNDDLRNKLIQTGDAILIEGNWWNDTYWGVCRGIGENRLGEILMDLRSDMVPEPFPMTD